MFKLFTLIYVLILPISAFAEVCKTTDTLTSHEHGCLRGDLLWSAPLGKSVDVEATKKYCSELSVVPDGSESWSLPTESEIHDLANAHPQLSFFANLDNLFWTSGNSIIHPITGARAPIGDHPIPTDVLCVQKYHPNCHPENSLGMHFCEIPAGTFMMGSLEAEEDSLAAPSKPQHLVPRQISFYEC